MLLTVLLFLNMMKYVMAAMISVTNSANPLETYMPVQSVKSIMVMITENGSEFRAAMSFAGIIVQTPGYSVKIL